MIKVNRDKRRQNRVRKDLKTKSGDNLEAQIILANNSVAMNHVKQALQDKCNVVVQVCKMTENFTVNQVLTTEHWLLASFAYDATTIEVLLSSSIDAVGTTAPNRVFTENIVGFLPRTGNIQTLWNHISLLVYDIG